MNSDTIKAETEAILEKQRQFIDAKRKLYSSLSLDYLRRMAGDIAGATNVESMNRDELTHKLIVASMEACARREALEVRKSEVAEIRKAQLQAVEEAHKQERILELRQQREIRARCLDYPFRFLVSGEYCNFPRPIPGQPLEDVGTFPRNIGAYYWVHAGKNDEEPWLCLCRLTNGVYVFFKGECDYTGFDCQGSMQIYASRDPNILLHYAMTSWEYHLYWEETEPAVAAATVAKEA